MGEQAPPRDHASVVRDAFARQARGFARSPLQTDPARLARLVEFVRPVPGERVLDVACGPGIVVAALQRAGLLAFGIDLTREMIREAASGEGRYVQGDVARLPFPDAIFDVVVSRNSFHHFAHPAAVMSEMARVARGGGRVVIEDMRAPDDERKRSYHEIIERLRDVSHARTLTRDELREIAAAAGLSGFDEVPVTLVIDFDEWVDRACPAPADRERARVMLEACVTQDQCGLRVWKEGDRLKFERQSLLFRAARPRR
jgi:ubiquinone/menaquinone biosynthesis C-methylase UbiE